MSRPFGARGEALILALAVALVLAAAIASVPRGVRLTGAARPRTAKPLLPKAAPPQLVTRLGGQLTDLQGNAVAGALVRLHRPGRGRPSVTQGHTDAGGHFQLVVAWPGRVYLEARRDGFARLWQPVVIRAGETRALGTLKLQPEALLSGRVMTDDDRPLPDAKVSVVSALDLPQRPSSPPAVVSSDASGFFVVRGLPAGHFYVEARADGFGPAVLRSVEAPNAGLLLRLRPLLALGGRVLADGLPAAGARVSLCGSGAWPPREVDTDRLGRFVFPGVPAGIYELRASRGQWISEPVPAVEIDNGAPVPTVDLELIQGGVLRGVVVEAGNGKAISGARITAGEELLGLHLVKSVSSTDGSFYLTPLLPGELQVTVEHDGFLPRRGLAVRVLAGENPVLRVTLEKGASLVGQVIDDTGRPVAGARLEVVGRARGSFIADRSISGATTQRLLWNRALGRPASAPPSAPASGAVVGTLGVTAGPIPTLPATGLAGDASSLAAPIPPAGPIPSLGVVPLGRAMALLTDATGHFDVRGLPHGNLSLVVRHPSYARQRSGPYRLKRGERREGLVITLHPGVALEGLVFDGDKQPIAGVAVAVSSSGDDFHQARRFTDEQGAFRLPNQSGRLRLSLSAPGYVPLVKQVEIDLTGPRPQRVSLTLEPARCRVSGLLVDRRGLAVAGARLQLTALTVNRPSRATAISNAQGEFTLASLGSLQYAARVTHPDYPEHRFELRCPAEVRWGLRYGGGLAFTVEDRQTREAVSAFRFVLRRPGGPVIRRDGAAGRAEVVPLPAGRYELSITAGRYAQQRITIWIPDAREPRRVTRRDVAVKLEMAGSVAGWVRDDRGLAVADVLVSVAGLQTRSDRQGRFKLQDVPPGEHVLTATHPDRGQGRLPLVEVKRGLATRGVVVDLAPGGEAPQDVSAGVAAELELRGNRVRFGKVRAGSAAERAGLVSGDEVVSVDGEDLGGLGLSEIRELLRGPAGSSVVLELRRNGRVIKRALRRESLP